MYVVEMQFMPFIEVAWVERLLPTDEIFSYESYDEAHQKAMELQANDPSGRLYRVKTVS